MRGECGGGPAQKRAAMLFDRAAAKPRAARIAATRASAKLVSGCMSSVTTAGRGASSAGGKSVPTSRRRESSLSRGFRPLPSQHATSPAMDTARGSCRRRGSTRAWPPRSMPARSKSTRELIPELLSNTSRKPPERQVQLAPLRWALPVAPGPVSRRRHLSPIHEARHYEQDRPIGPTAPTCTPYSTPSPKTNHPISSSSLLSVSLRLFSHTAAAEDPPSLRQ